MGRVWKYAGEKDHDPGFLFVFPPYSFQISAFTFNFNPREMSSFVVRDGRVTVEKEKVMPGG